MSFGIATVNDYPTVVIVGHKKVDVSRILEALPDFSIPPKMKHHVPEVKSTEDRIFKPKNTHWKHISDLQWPVRVFWTNEIIDRQRKKGPSTGDFLVHGNVLLFVYYVDDKSSFKYAVERMLQAVEIYHKPADRVAAVALVKDSEEAANQAALNPMSHRALAEQLQTALGTDSSCRHPELANIEAFLEDEMEDLEKKIKAGLMNSHPLLKDLQLTYHKFYPKIEQNDQELNDNQELNNNKEHINNEELINAE